MKGLLFHQQLEVRLEIRGEEFRQGDQVPCTLSVKNRGTGSQEITSVSLTLAVGDAKKIKQKSDDAFKPLAAADAPGGWQIQPGAEEHLTWSFSLDRNAPITDKSQSLYVLYGALPSGGQEARGNLQLSVLAHADVEGILSVFETSFQFVLKGQRSKDGWMIASLKPPSSQRFITVDELELGFRFEDDVLLLSYLVKAKKLSAGPSTLSIEKKKSEHVQELRASDYRAPGGYVDSRLLEEKIEDALATVTGRPA